MSISDLGFDIISLWIIAWLIISFILSVILYIEDKKNASTPAANSYLHFYINQLFELLFAKQSRKYKFGLYTKQYLVTFWAIVAYYFGAKIFKGILLEIAMLPTNTVTPFSNTKELAEFLK